MQSLPQEVIELLRCPLSGAPLGYRDIDVAGRKRADGADAQKLVANAEAFIATPDGSIAYAVRDGIACLLPGLALVLRDSKQPAFAADEVTASVQAFYDQIGWNENDNGIFEDAARYEDLRPVSATYINACHARLSRHFEPTGKFILDVASGPVQYDAYLRYHAGYERRICVDLSIAALRAARRRVGDNGVYILGDITVLPFADGQFDAVISLHTIYHVPFPKQPTALHEVYRVLKPGRRAAVVYSWGDHSLVRRSIRLPLQPLRWLRRLVARLRGRAARPGVSPEKPALGLYSHQASPTWFTGESWPFRYCLSCWRMADVEAMKVLVQPWLFGGAILRILWTIEERWPRRLGLWGQYPIIEISKPAETET